MFHWSYISCGKNLMAKFINFAIKILILAGFFGLFIGLSFVVELILIR
ncbi:hypothetical protein P19250A_0045 [Methylophilaceae phage P19250A]|nr:hypothetical protein P19250A_0045 [Methylophilaceae phage P19250A]